MARSGGTDPQHTSAFIAAVASFATWGLVPIYWKLLSRVPALEILARLADRFHSHCFGRGLYSCLWLRPFPVDRARALHQFRPLRIAAEAVRHRCHSRPVFGNAFSPAAGHGLSCSPC